MAAAATAATPTQATPNSNMKSGLVGNIQGQDVEAAKGNPWACLEREDFKCQQSDGKRTANATDWSDYKVTLVIGREIKKTFSQAT